MAHTGVDTGAQANDEVPDWAVAGSAWSHAATDWAYRFEPYARDAVEHVLAECEVGPGTRMLDVACGSGFALGRAERLGASTAGLDAAAGLIDIASRRAPGAELVHGDMFSLPWPEETFDVVVSFNGIWGGCDAAVAEMARVCRPGGCVGITFWGDPGRLDLLDYFLTVGANGPGVDEEIVSLAAINTPGVAEGMAEAAGLAVLGRGTTQAILELVDEDDAWRTLRSPGLVLPSIAHTGDAVLRSLVLDAIERFRSPDGTFRLTNELVHVLAERPR